MMLWLRHIRALPALGGAVVAAVIIRLLIASSLEDGPDVHHEMAALWVAAAFVLPVMMLFTTEDAWDRTAVRSVGRRRVVLLTGTVIIAAVVAVLCFPDNTDEYGSLATFRNVLALIGVGLLGLTVLPRWAGWVPPAVLAIFYSGFSAPWAPTPMETVWAALRMRGTLIDPYSGAVDLSWWTCLVVFALGSASWLWRWRVPALTAGTGAVRSRAGRPVDFRRGRRRAMVLPVVVGAPVVVIVWTLGVQLKYWGGSVHLLVTENFPVLFGFCMPVALAGGVVAGQYRWRSGVTVWESLSGRGVRAVTWAALRPVLGWLAAGTVVVTVLFLALAGGGALADGVDASVVVADLGAVLGLILLVDATVIVGGVVGVLAGLRWRGIWIAPVGLIVAVVAGATLAYQLPAEDRDSTVAVDDMECRDAGPDLSVCAEPRNTGYLDAAVTTVGQLYASSPFRADLPQRVYLVDNAYAEQADGGPVVGLSGQRGITAPDRLDAEDARQFIEQTIANSCVPEGVEGLEVLDYWMDGTELLFEDPATFPEWAESGSTPERTRDMLARAQECFAGAR